MLKRNQGTIQTFSRSFSTKRRRKAKAALKPKLKKVSALVAHTQNTYSSKSSEGFQIQSNIQKNISAIRSVLGNDQKEVVDKISSRQKQFQEFVLPEWLRNPFQDRERKPGVIVMDRLWYTWNIAAAFVPGLFVLFITQYYKGEAREFYENQQKKDRDRLIEGNTVDEQGIGISRDEHYSKSLLGTLSTEYIWNAVKSIVGFHETLSDNEELEETKIELEIVPTSMEVFQTPSEPPTIDELRQRIEFLESQIKIHSQDKPKQQQSGIRARIDERKRRRFLEEDRIKQEETITETDTNVLRTFLDDMMVKVKNYWEEQRLEVSNHLSKELQEEEEEEEEKETSSHNESHDVERLQEEKASSNGQVMHETKNEYNNDILNHDSVVPKPSIWGRITRMWRRND